MSLINVALQVNVQMIDEKFRIKKYTKGGSERILEWKKQSFIYDKTNNVDVQISEERKFLWYTKFRATVLRESI